MVGLDLGMVVVGLGNLSVGLGSFLDYAREFMGGMKGKSNEWEKKRTEKYVAICNASCIDYSKNISGDDLTSSLSFLRVGSGMGVFGVPLLYAGFVGFGVSATGFTVAGGEGVCGMLAGWRVPT